MRVYVYTFAIGIAAAAASDVLSQTPESATRSGHSSAAPTERPPTEAWKPAYLAGLPLHLRGAGTTRVDSRFVRWEAWEEDAPSVQPLPPGSLERLLDESHTVAIRVAGALGIPTTTCDSTKLLYIVHLDGATINDESRFGAWRTVNGGYLHVIDGLYDPTLDAPENAVLLFTERNWPRSRILVHELGHYWYDRMCMYRASDVKTETFARAVEDEWMDTSLPR